MINRQRLAMWIVFAALSLPAYADRASDAYKHGVRAERQQNYDAAYEYYKQAHTLAPNDAKYLAAYTRMRFNAAMQHVRTGQNLRNTGALPEAMAEFQHAVEIDSSSFLAQQELRRTADMIRRQERQRSAPKVEPAVPSWPTRIGETVELQPLSNAPITLRMTGNADAAYKTICKLAGINVIIDPDYRPQKITVDLTDVTHPRSVGHGSPPVEDFLASCVAEHDFCGRGFGRKTQRARTERHADVLPSKYLDPGRVDGSGQRGPPNSGRHPRSTARRRKTP